MTKRSNNPSRGESGRDEGRNESTERNEGIEREVQRGRGQNEGDGEVGLSGAERGSKGGDQASQRPGGQEQGGKQQGGQQQGGQQQGQQQGSESTRRGTGEERQPVEKGREFEGENVGKEEGDTSRDR